MFHSEKPNIIEFVGVITSLISVLVVLIGSYFYRIENMNYFENKDNISFKDMNLETKLLVLNPFNYGMRK